MFEAMPDVGSVLIATEDLHFCKTGEKAVVYEQYDRDDPKDSLGVSLVFQGGFYDGFSREDLNTWGLKMHHKPLPVLATYRFTNVSKLMDDWDDGFFDEGFAV